MAIPVTHVSLSERIEELLASEGPLPIVAAGAPVLRDVAEPYEGQIDDALLGRFVARMRETMLAAPGVGLAAPQVGIPLSIAVVEDAAHGPEPVLEARERTPYPFRVLVNPDYEPEGGALAAFFEGCLSVPGWQAVVTRYARVRLRGQDERGNPIDELVTGWPARIVQHETDHLRGRLYLDVAQLRSLSANDAVARHWAHPTPELAARRLGFEMP